jgi:putative transposase
MLWIARTGCLWRDLPSEFLNWRSVYIRWRRWVQRRVWAQVLA